MALEILKTSSFENKINCWEFKKCGREPGGAKVKELGICPAAQESSFNGIFGGKNSGRACWVVAGTFCKGEVQGSFAQKFKNCANCDFFKKVQEEESPHFQPVSVLLSYIDQSHEQRVDERTNELRQAKEEIARAMEELETVNERLTEMNRELEFTQKIASLDMAMAARIQKSFFPDTPPESVEWDIAFIFEPLSGVSGDLYDFYYKDNELGGVSLFDVSGHGIASGLLTLLARSIAYRRVIENRDKKLSRVMEFINRDLITEMGSIDNYLTGILLRFTGDNVEYVNAGHADLLIKRGATGLVKKVRPKDREFKGNFLGVAAMERPFNSIIFKIAKDDVLLLYSDCFEESENDYGEQYGVERISASLGSVSSEKSAREILKHLISNFSDFTGNRKIKDDLTLILLKRKDSADSASAFII